MAKLKQADQEPVKPWLVRFFSEKAADCSRTATVKAGRLHMSDYNL
jgi:hypothetical protein